MQTIIDIVIFTINDNELEVLLIKKDDKHALPGGQLNTNESLEATARRELKEETGVEQAYLEQLYTLKNNDTIIITYFALIDSSSLKLTSQSEWYNVKKLPKTTSDNEEIISYALQRLRYKLEYTSAGMKLLPKYFTLTELKNVYETILGEKLDKRNFVKKILSMGVLEKTNKVREGSHRPAIMYSFKETKHKTMFKRIQFEK